MNPEAPIVGEVVTIISDRKVLTGPILGRIPVEASSLMQRDNRFTEVVVILTDTNNTNPFERTETITYQSLLEVESFEDGETLYTQSSIEEANRIFGISERLIPAESFTFANVEIKAGKKIVIENNGKLVLMEANSITYDKDGKPLLLLTSPDYKSDSNFVAALTPDEFEEYVYHFIVSPENLNDAMNIKELLSYMLHHTPDGIEPDQSTIRRRNISVEMVIDAWNRAISQLDLEYITNIDAYGLRGAEHCFVDIYATNMLLGEDLAILLRAYQSSIER